MAVVGCVGRVEGDGGENVDRSVVVVLSSSLFNKSVGWYSE
jgi:hypothetical protein